MRETRETANADMDQMIPRLVRDIASGKVVVISGLLDRSPGFSRSRLDRQYAAAPAGIPPAEAGTPV